LHFKSYLLGENYSRVSFFSALQHLSVLQEKLQEMDFKCVSTASHQRKISDLHSSLDRTM